MRIAVNSLDQHNNLLVYEILGCTLILAAFVVHILVNRTKHIDRRSLGFVTATFLYVIMSLVIDWSPHWQIYYGICLYCAIYCCGISVPLKKYLIITLIAQGISFAITAQIWDNNADITMTLANIDRGLITSFKDSFEARGIDVAIMTRASRYLYLFSEFATLVVLLKMIGEPWSSIQLANKYRNPRFALLGGASFMATWLIMIEATLIALHGNA